MSADLSRFRKGLARIRSRVREIKINLPKKIRRFAQSISRVPARSAVEVESQKIHFSFPDSLNLKPRDRVRVRSRKEIKQTLNSHNTFRGLQFMEPMWKYCGREMTVYKHVRLVYDGGDKMKKCRNTVLLRGAVCDGRNVLHEEGCDRSCFFFWKEAWLEKVE